MRKALLIFAFAAFSAVAVGLWAEPAPASLTVDEAVAAALRNNLTIKTAATGEKAKKAASDLSFNKFYPSVSVSGSVVGFPGPPPESSCSTLRAMEGSREGSPRCTWRMASRSCSGVESFRR